MNYGLRPFLICMICMFALMLGACTPPGLAKAVSDHSQTEDSEEIYEETEPIQQENKTIYVYVTGAVNTPGVYEMQSTDRVYQAIEKAGGLTEDADISSLNQAQILQDEQQIKVASVSDRVAEQSAAAEEMGSDGRININSASKEQLMELPGVGESKASAIISYREEHGRFAKTEDIMNISGIKEGLYAQIEDLICAE